MTGAGATRPRGRLTRVSLGCFGLCATIGLLTRFRTPQLDLTLHDLLVRDRSDAVVGLAREVTEAGSTTVIWPVIGVAALVFPRSHGAARWVTTALVAGGPAAAIGSRLLLSDVVHRARPPAAHWATTPGGFAFPSGHTNAATIGAGVLAWALTRRLPGRGAREAVWGGAVLWAGSVGVTRALLGVHWPLDVLGGWLIGVGWLAGMAAVLAGRHFTEPPTGGSDNPVDVPSRGAARPARARQWNGSALNELDG